MAAPLPRPTTSAGLGLVQLAQEVYTFCRDVVQHLKVKADEQAALEARIESLEARVTELEP